MTTRSGNAGDFQAVLPMMRQHRLRQQQSDPVLYALHPGADRLFLQWIGQVAQDSRAALLVAEEVGRIVGFLYATVEKDPPIYLHADFGLVREWWVEPAFRGRGVGKALIRRAATDLAAAGIRLLRVRTAPDDDIAHVVLRQCGFREGSCELVMNLRPRT